ncbi:hypothetical protein XBI1_780001 [Xenorhabdus bovienii str. Intermedium]|uniref:Uncharacterized protein n=1 Tax=Xenorhabdus bovienii str. Intermedium TaxID=1379677 RepID=A0A077QNT9_XENBV|nr:hypothetical protein XBI1_780001 [Xenorhabdus bovienii str. Intermedium]
MVEVYVVFALLVVSKREGVECSLALACKQGIVEVNFFVVHSNQMDRAGKVYFLMENVMLKSFFE